MAKVKARNPVFRAALQMPPIERHDVLFPIRVLNLDADKGAVGYYRVGVPFHYLGTMRLCQTMQKAEIPGDHDLRGMQRAVDLADVVVIERPWTTEQSRFIVSAVNRGKAVIVDTDDHLEHVRDLGNNALSVFWDKEHVARYRECLFLATRVSVASLGLKEVYERELPGKVVYLPNPVDVLSERWNVPHSKYPEHDFTIGLAGGHSHNLDMGLVKEPLQVILERHPDVRLKAIGYHPSFLDSLPAAQVTRCEYTELENFPPELADIDVLLAPLQDHPFNRCKTPTKLFEATMAGCAVMGSPVGPEYRQWAARGLGVFPHTTQEWIEELERLISQPRRARELNRSAVKYVLAERSAQAVVPLWYDCMRDALTEPRADIPYGFASAEGAYDSRR